MNLVDGNYIFSPCVCLCAHACMCVCVYKYLYSARAEIQAISFVDLGHLTTTTSALLKTSGNLLPEK